MTTIEQTWIDSLLADVSYVDGLFPGLIGDSIAAKITSRMTEPLAKTIGARFEVLSLENELR